jgi:hypothetical protein
MNYEAMTYIAPLVETPVCDAMGYHNRRGGHGFSINDWERFLDSADRHFGRRKE